MKTTICFCFSRPFLKANEGAVSLVFALCIPLFISAAGIAVDIAQAYNVKNRLADALDKAALAAGSTTGTTQQVEDRVEKFFTANYPEEDLGTIYYMDVIVGNDNTVTVTAYARVDTVFMNILGQDYIDVSTTAKVKRELAGVEVVLVLDVTGSMAGNNIAALKTASTNFLNIMFSNIDDYDYLKIGLVPFSASVNVGRYGLGQTPTGGYYGSAFVSRPATDDYVSPASNINFGTSSPNWSGCITERAYPLDTNDVSTPNWGMYRYPRICSSYRANGTCRTYANNNPNTACTQSRVVPMTNSQTTLQSAINGLQTGGNTYGNVGMVWGYHLISPAAPFSEGVAFNDPDWSKTVIMMTDGDNTINSTYSAYGANATLTEADLDNRFLETCTNMKNEGITIYTITFQSGISNATREYFRNCASDTTKYFNAPSNQTLIDAFEEIAHQLSELHIVQ